MITLTQAVADLSAAPRPILFLDTCTLLDILRKVDDDGLDLREKFEAIRALFATPTALFKAAPR
jgi:hypothetical protein